MKVLVSSPESDNITRYLHVWSKKLVSDFDGRHEFTHLEGEHANQKRFYGLLSKDYVDIVLINGHGSDATITGHNQEILIDSVNVDLLKGKTVHALSCRTAKTFRRVGFGGWCEGLCRI